MGETKPSGPGLCGRAWMGRIVGDKYFENQDFYPFSNFLGSSLLRQHDVTVNVATPETATASQLQIKAEPNDNGVLDIEMEINAQEALTTSTPTRAAMAASPATYSSCSRADESLQLLSSVKHCDVGTGNVQRFA